MKILLVSGTRDLEDNDNFIDIIGTTLSEAYQELGEATLIHGDAPGVDTLASYIWKEFGLPQKAFPADWKNLGKAAGPIRNQQMVDLNPDLCIAFPSKNSRGTWDCVRRAKKANIETRIVELK